MDRQSAFPCLKALVRDIHRFQDDCGGGMRKVPLVYAMQDMGYPVRGQITNYMTCTADHVDDVLDVMGINVYSYCSDREWDGTNPYHSVYYDFYTLAQPFIFTEYGCPMNREFHQVSQMMNEMQEMLSGGLVYEYSDHGSYGIVTTSGSRCSDSATTWLDSAFNLQTAYSSDDWSIYDNYVGPPYVWTGTDDADDEWCEWRPPTTVEHVMPECPRDHDPTWADPLPPLPPEYLPVECPDYPLSAVEAEEYACREARGSPAPTLSQTPSPAPSSPTPSPSFSLPPTALPTDVTAKPTGAPTPAPTAAPTPSPSTTAARAAVLEEERRAALKARKKAKAAAAKAAAGQHGVGSLSEAQVTMLIVGLVLALPLLASLLQVAVHNRFVAKRPAGTTRRMLAATLGLAPLSRGGRKARKRSWAAPETRSTRAAAMMGSRRVETAARKWILGPGGRTAATAGRAPAARR